LRSRKLQTALTLLTLFAAATLLTVATSALVAGGGAYDRLLERTHGAHLWFSLDPTRVTAEEAERTLSALPDVEATTGARRTYVMITGDRRSSEQADIQRLQEWPGEGVAVSRPEIVAGRAPLPGETYAILLDRNVAYSAKVGLGDTVQLPTPAGAVSLDVVGLFVSAEWCPYYYCQPAPSYLAPAALEALGLLPSSTPGAEVLEIGLRLQDPADAKSIRETAEAALPAGAVLASHTWENARDLAGLTLMFQRVLFPVFSIVAGLAAGFLIANTIGESVRAQTHQMGLLKAVGFTGTQLIAIYLAESLGLALVASLSGLAAGWLLSPLILRGATAQFGETTVGPSPWSVAAIPLCTLAIAALFTLWPVRHAVRLDAVTAIRAGAEPPRRRSYRLPHRLLPLAMGISDALSRPRRSLLMALGLGIATLTLTVALITGAFVRAINTDPRLGIVPDGDLFLSRSVYLADTEVRRLIAEQPDISAYYADAIVDFDIPAGRVQNDLDPYIIHLRGGDLGSFEFPLLEGRLFERPNEVVVGYGLAQEQGLRIGDPFTVLVHHEPLTFEVVGIYREVGRLGLVMMAAPEAVPGTEPFTYWLKVRPGADVQTVTEALRSGSNGLLDVTVLSQEEQPEMLTTLDRVMGALSLVLGAIGVVGVFSMVWMNVQERQREFGLLKAVGMTPEQVSLSVLIGASILALAGYAVGVPGGVGLQSVLMNVLGQMVGFGPNYNAPPLDWAGLALLLPGIVLVAVIGAWIPARRAGRVSVVETLRYE
jgi:putative ABC transport system permease protein